MMSMIDRLATIRQDLRKLRAEQATIRKAIISGDVDPHGTEYDAHVRRHVILIPKREQRAGNGHISDALRQPYWVGSSMRPNGDD
jgi:hypothetical protein